VPPAGLDAFFAESFVYAVGNAFYMRVRRGGADNEIIADRRGLADVDYLDLFGFLAFGRFRCQIGDPA
jgi:hypothetical protein